MTALLAAIPTRATEIETAAQTLVEQLAAGKFTEATARFDAQMRESLPPEKLTAVWQGLEAKAGKYRGVKTTTTQLKGAFRVVVLGCTFEKMPLDTKVVFDAAGKISGLYFAPQVAEWQPPDYASPAQFDERPVTVRGGPYELPGFVTMPHGKGPFAGVLLVHGSGPHDADETIGPNKPFRDLAWGLAARGIAVLRYTKRTRIMSQEEKPSVAGLTVDREVLDDARAALQLLGRTAGVDSTRLYVVGHSLGGMLAPRLAASDKHIAGIVIMAGNVRPTEDVALEQVQWMAKRDGTVSEAEKNIIAAMEKAVAEIRDPALADTALVDFLGAPMPGSYWLDLRGYHPDTVAASLSIPILLLRGDRDYQISQADFDLWKKALAGKRNVVFKLYPGLNHLFTPGSGEPGPEDYSKPGHVGAAVIQDIEAWIRAQDHS
jgi:dienelactone hydrolase